VQILLVVLRTLDQRHVGERGELFCAGRLRVARQDSDSVSTALSQGYRKVSASRGGSDQCIVPCLVPLVCPAHQCRR
jgi:hypothetical protein